MMWEYYILDIFLDVTKFTILTPLSLLILCKLSFQIVGLKYLLCLLCHLNLPKIFVIFMEFIEYTFYLLIEDVFHMVSFILGWCMNIMDNDITPATS
jgi:hypothetical protein